MMQYLLDFNQTGMLLSKPRGNIYFLKEKKVVTDNFGVFYTLKNILKMVMQ